MPLALIHSPAGGTAARYWYVLDGHANVVALTDSAGNVVDSYSYDAWGKPLSVNKQVGQPYRYAGYWYDTEQGWYPETREHLFQSGLLGEAMWAGYEWLTTCKRTSVPPLLR